MGYAMKMRSIGAIVRLIAFVLVLLLYPSRVMADLFLDVTSVTPGVLGSSGGSFSGFLGTVLVTGAFTSSDNSLFVTPVGSGFSGTVVSSLSPQYSYSNVYTPATSATDQVGYGKSVTASVGTITIDFHQMISNPIIHIANLDHSVWNFDGTPGIGLMSLMSGNGSAGDGLGIAGTQVFDLNPVTFDNMPPTVSPPTSGGRSAYGSVQLHGSFSQLKIAVASDGGGTTITDGGNFTLSVAAVPEPSSLMLSIVIAAFMIARLSRTKMSQIHTMSVP